MVLSAIIKVLFAVVSLGTLVIGDPTAILTLTTVTVTTPPNEWFDPWTVDILNGKRSSLLNIKIPAKKILPDTMQMRTILNVDDQPLPFEYTTSVCDALSDKIIGSSFVKAAVPQEKFPKSCPFIPGTYDIIKWEPPMENVPPGIPDSAFTGSIIIEEEGKEPYVRMDAVGRLSHALPRLG